MPATAPRHSSAAKSISPRFGWVNIVMAALLMVATLPGRTQGLGLLTEPLLKDLGLDRITYANINLWATLLGAAFCFPAGYFIDRFGLRLVSVVLTLLLGATVWKMGGFAGGAAGLFLLLLFTRALGQSALSVASITAVGKTGGSRYGLRMGLYSFLLSLFFIIAFGVVGNAVTQHGWRIAWQQIGLALLVVVAPLSLLLLRENKIAETNDAAAEKRPAHPNFTFSQALRTPAFWIFGLAVALFNLVTSGLGLFNQSVLAQYGFDENAFHHFLEATTAASLIGQMLCGWLAQRWPMTRLMGIGMALYAISLGILPFVKNSAQLWTFAGLIGCAGGFIIVIFFAIWSQAFGHAHLGRIQGAAQLLTVLSSAAGPLLFAKCYALAGSYSPLLFSLVGIVLVMGVAAWKVVLPKPPLSASIVSAKPALNPL